MFNESKNGGADHNGKAGKEGQEQQLLLPRQNRNGRKRELEKGCLGWKGDGECFWSAGEGERERTTVRAGGGAKPLTRTPGGPTTRSTPPPPPVIHIRQGVSGSRGELWESGSSGLDGFRRFDWPASRGWSKVASSQTRSTASWRGCADAPSVQERSIVISSGSIGCSMHCAAGWALNFSTLIFAGAPMVGKSPSGFPTATLCP